MAGRKPILHLRPCIECNSPVAAGKYRKQRCPSCYGKLKYQEYIKTRKEELLKYNRDYRQLNLERSRLSSREAAKRQRARLKKEILNGLGERCACCGEDCPAFLTVDHINNDGKAHRDQLASKGRTSRGVQTESVYRDILKEGCPPDRYRILCYNCNCGRRHGPCPHETMYAALTGMKAAS